MAESSATSELQQWVKAQGADLWELLYNPRARAQWYRADGTPVEGLLPCDPYHTQRYRARGWTLRPREVVQAKRGRGRPPTGKPRAKRVRRRKATIRKKQPVLKES